MQALTGEMTLARLQQIDMAIDAHWAALCKKIPHLNKRIEMILEVKCVEDTINAYTENNKPFREILYYIRLTMLAMEVSVGTTHVTRLLETMPLPMIPALVGLHLQRGDWIQNDTVDETEFLAGFLTLLSTCQQTMYSKDEEGCPAFCFTTCFEDTKRFALELGLPEVVIEEIATRADAILEAQVDDMIESGVLEEDGEGVVTQKAS